MKDLLTQVKFIPAVKCASPCNMIAISLSSLAQQMVIHSCILCCVEILDKGGKKHILLNAIFDYSASN